MKNFKIKGNHRKPLKVKNDYEEYWKLSENKKINRNQGFYF